jgi:hypothetical protein
MPQLMSTPSRKAPLPAPLSYRIGEDARADEIADAVVAIWRDVDEALAPIIGRRGVDALCRRSLSLTASLQPVLAGGQEGALSSAPLAELRALLAQQSRADAAAHGSAFLQTFQELLSSLVGPLLTDRLLRSAWANAPGPTAQDTLP